MTILTPLQVGLFALSILGLFTVVVTGLRHLDRRRQRQHPSYQAELQLDQLKCLLHIHQRPTTADTPLIRSSLAMAEEEHKLGCLALQYVRLNRAGLHARIGTMAVQLSSYLRSPQAKADAVNEMLLGMTLLKKGKYPLAEEHFGKVWKMDDLPANLKILALQAHIWLLREWGQEDGAQEEESVLASLQKALSEGRNILQWNVEPAN